MRTPRLLCLLAAAALPGCELIGAKTPAAAVMDVQLRGVALTQAQLAVTLCITNPNRTALDFSQVAVTLDVAGTPLIAGASVQPVSLPPLASTPVPFSVTAQIDNLGPQVLGILHAGQVNYRVHGTVTLPGSVGLTIPFSRSGHLDPLATGLDLALGAPDPHTTACSASAGIQ